ncbi:MAG: transposase [Deltaproteobacteria bacterium]|nr:transposase [Deltaproteobacteria bacterium]
MNSDDLDVNRVRVFRQLKKEIRGSKDYLIVGIDIAKDKHNAFFGTAQGKTLWRRLVFDNSIEGFNKLRNQVEALKVEHDLKKVVFGMEPTANYHKPLGEHLIGWGEEVVLVSGNAVKHNRQLMDGRWDKHDTKDSANVADLISQGKCLYYDYPLVDVRWKKRTPKSDTIIYRRRCQDERDSTRALHEGVSRGSSKNGFGWRHIITEGRPAVIIATLDLRELGKGE